MPATAAEWAAVAFLCLLFVLTALCQVPWSGRDRLRALDLFGLIPFWNFFAPRPGTWDFHLLYRDQLTDGSITPWREILLTAERRWWHALWHPHRRLKKALFDAGIGLWAYPKVEGRDLRISVPYLELLTYVSGLPRLYAATKTQFLVMASSLAHPDIEPVELVRSDMHPL